MGRSGGWGIDILSLGTLCRTVHELGGGPVLVRMEVAALSIQEEIS